MERNKRRLQHFLLFNPSIMFSHKKCNYWKCANAVGIFLVALFVICFVWYYVRPVEQELHLRLFRMAFFGFDEMNVASFVLGAIQSYVWGYVGVGLWTLAGCCLKPGECCGGK